MKIVQIELSDQGRCFVVGEVSGHFSALQRMIRELDFDPSTDQLILNGNFTGYCLSSRELTTWLDKPWVIPLLGKSEADLLSNLEGKRRPSLSGQWLGMLGNKEKGRIRSILHERPVLAQITKKDKTIAVSHAALPAEAEWSSFKASLMHPDLSSADAVRCFSDRQADLQFLGLISGSKAYSEPIKGLMAGISTYRDEQAADRIGRSGNRYFLKCSAHMEHGHVYKQSCILPYIELNSFYDAEVSRIWSKDQDIELNDYQRTTSSLKQHYISVR